MLSAICDRVRSPGRAAAAARTAAFRPDRGVASISGDPIARLEEWSEDRRLRPILVTCEEGLGKQVTELARQCWEQGEEGERSMVSQLLASTHEMIFEVRDREPLLHLISWSFDPGTFEMVLSRNWEFSGFEDDPEELKWYVSLALIHRIPVVPNSSSDEAPLADVYRSVIEDGVERSSEDGAIRMALARYGGELGPADEVLRRLKETDQLTAGEEKILRDALEDRVKENVEAARVLAGLRTGIGELRDLLSLDTIAEEDLQRCLTRNPLLFGSQYKAVIPKHQLGAEYEMDYALVRLGGLADLVEIERSTDTIYTKAGNPSARLTHAEQQVLDWLAWIDKYGGYAKDRLPELERPVGYVVIGRDAELTEQDGERLRRRNAAFAGTIEILTFDALLRRAGAVLEALTGRASTS